MLIQLLMGLWWLGQSDSHLQTQFYELIYQAEVHGKSRESIAQFYELLDQAKSIEDQQAVIRALSIVTKSHASREPKANLVDFARVLQNTQAVIVHPPQAYLLVAQQWFGLGDWIGDYRLMRIDFSQVVLENEQREQRYVSLPQLQNQQPNQSTVGTKLFEASVRDVLAFATRKMSLNYFIPSDFKQSFTGYIAAQDWQNLIDNLSNQSNIIWTRRRGSIVFERGQTKANSATMISGIDTKNRLLGSLLEEIANTVGLELVLFDETLVDVAIDLYLADQPWNEALDCLSLMGDFHWDMVSQENGTLQLVITRN